MPATGTHSAFAYSASGWDSDSGSHWSATPGATATATVDIGPGGGTITLQGDANVETGYALLQIDSATPVLADQYANTTVHSIKDWLTTPVLPEGRHTVKLTVTSQKNPAATATLFSIGGVKTSNGNIVLPSAPGPTAPTLTATATKVSDTVYRLDWDYTAGSDPSAVDQLVRGRNGTDSTGYGAWSGPEDVADGSDEFNNLTPSVTELWIEMRKAGQRVGSRVTVPITVTTGGGGPTTPPGGGTTTPPPSGALVGVRSRLPWNSGAFVAFNSGTIAPYQTGRGRLLDNFATFTSRETPASNVNPWFLDHGQSVLDAGGWVTVGVPLWANNQSIGADNTSMWTQLAAIFASRGIASRTVIRLGWEMNLPQGHHAVTTANRAQWVVKFKAAANILRAQAPGIKIAFNPNEGNDQTGVPMFPLATELKDYFDYAGPDMYNWWSPVNTEAEWATRYTRAGGIKAWEDFCRANNKGFTLPEWGGYPGSSGQAGGGHLSNGQLYAQKLIGRFAALSAEGIPVIESHFNEPAPYIANALWSPQQMPVMAGAVAGALAAQPTL